MFKWLLFLAFYLPFQLALNPTEGVDLASLRVLILALFFVWVAQSLKRKNFFVPANLKTWLVLSFLFLSLISTAAARNTDWSVRKLLFLFSIFPLYFVVSFVVDRRGKMIKIIKMLAVSGTAAALIGIAQFIFQFVIGLKNTYQIWADYVILPFLGKNFSEAVLQNPSWLVNISGKTYLRATSVFPDPHMFSFYLGLLIPMVAGLHLTSEKKSGWIIFSLASLVAADFLTFSRGGYLGIFAGILAAVILFWEKIEKKHKAGTAVLVGLVIVVFFIPNPVSQRFFSSFDIKEGSNKGRIEIWKKAEEIILNKPVGGTGIGNYPLEIKATADYREPIYAHNTYLDIAAETGVLNGLVWLGLLILVAKDFLKRGREDVLFLGGGLSIIVFSVHSLVETAIYSPAVLALFLIIMSFSNIKPSQNVKAISDSQNV